MLRQVQQGGMRGMPRSLMRALFAGGKVGVGVGRSEDLTKTTFGKDMTQQVAPQNTSRGGEEGPARDKEEEGMKEGRGKEEKGEKEPDQ